MGTKQFYLSGVTAGSPTEINDLFPDTNRHSHIDYRDRSSENEILSRESKNHLCRHRGAIQTQDNHNDLELTIVINRASYGVKCEIYKLDKNIETTSFNYWDSHKGRG